MSELVITGEMVSITVTVNEHVAVLPDESVAIELTDVVPIANNDPETLLEVTRTPQLSVALTLKFTFAPQTPTGA